MTEGLWKCRICSWDCQGRTCLLHHNQNPKLLNAKTIDQQRLCFFHENKGTEFHHESSEVEANGVDSTFHGKIPMKGNNGITNHNEENGNSLQFISNQNGEHQKQNNLSHSSLQPSEISFEEVDKTEIGEIEVIKDVENEFDVETVIKKQETHDLFCPNCNSCITKRVILRKRKRKIPVPGEITKRNKPETSFSSEVNLVSDEVISNEYDHEREPDVFRCLSCFSIFMPTGDGFKFFRMFGNKNNQENSQSSQKDVAVKKSWFSNIFASDKVEQSNNQGLSRPEVNLRTTNFSMDLAKDQVQSAIPSVNQQQQQQQLQYPNTTGYGVNGRLDVDSLTPSVNGDKNTPSLSQASNTIKQPIFEESDKVVRESNGSYTPKTNSSHTTNGNMDMEKNQGQSATPSVNGGENAAQGLNIIKQPIAHESDEAVRDSTDSQSAEAPDHLVTSYHTEFNTQSDYPGMFVVKPPLNNTETEQDLISPHHHDGLTLHVPPNVGSLIIDNSNMNQLLDVTIQTNTPDLEIGSRAVEQGGGTLAAGGRSLDIVKSIVYGGLLEIIASLSVVASAVGADAATLNVLALGLANIFGGLIVISHDLWDLKNEVAREEDRYQQLLGRRADFPLHMLVSLLSYLVFGFLPPVVYGFSFRESNDRDFKLLMVAAASTVCIMILAAGKAYVQCPRKSYIKTISYYIVFGFAVSGVSYFFGELIMKLLEKIHIFPSGQAVNLSFHGAGTKPALIATY